MCHNWLHMSSFFFFFFLRSEFFLQCPISISNRLQGNLESFQLKKLENINIIPNTACQSNAICSLVSLTS